MGLLLEEGTDFMNLEQKPMREGDSYWAREAATQLRRRSVATSGRSVGRLSSVGPGLTVGNSVRSLPVRGSADQPGSLLKRYLAAIHASVDLPLWRALASVEGGHSDGGGPRRIPVRSQGDGSLAPRGAAPAGEVLPVF